MYILYTLYSNVNAKSCSVGKTKSQSTRYTLPPTDGAGGNVDGVVYAATFAPISSRPTDEFLFFLE